MFKVRWWTSPTKHTLYVFNDTKPPTTLKEKHTWIPHRLYEDDNINTITKKLVVHLPNIRSPDDIYLWGERTLDDLKPHHMYFITHCFKKENKIQYEHFQQAVRNVYDASLPEGEYNMIGKDVALKLLMNNVQTGCKVVDPISFQYVYDSYVEQVCYDPRRCLTQDHDALSTNSLNTITIGSFGLQDNSIHMWVYETQQKFYFPFHKAKSKTDMTSLKAFVEQLDVAETTIDTYQLKNKFNDIETYISFMQGKCNENNVNERVNLYMAFERFHASTEMPFIRLKTNSNILYKIDKPSLLTIPTKDLERWTQIQKYGHLGSNIVFKLQFLPKSFCTLTINEYLVYDVKFNIGVDSRVSLSQVYNFFDTINNLVIKPLQLFFEKAYMPSLTPNNITLSNVVTYNSLAMQKKTFKLTQLTDVTTSKFFPYFALIPNPKEKHIIHLQYKKVSNYIKYNNIEYFITMHYTLPRDVLIAKLMDTFVMSKEEAETEYDKWASKNQVEFVAGEDQNVVIKPRYDNFVNIKIKINDVINTRFIISGIKDMTIHQRILELLKILLDWSMSDSKVDTTQIDVSAFDKQMFDTTQQKTSEIVHFKDISPTDLTAADEDLDDDFLALEEEFVKDDEVAPVATESKAGPSSPVVSKGKTHGPVLGILKAADKALFDYTPPVGKKRSDFPSICGWTDTRQPMVITPEEKERIDRNYPGAIDDFVHTGSTQTLASRNMYICPKIWCPKSRVAMTYEQYKANNQRCPNADEDPVLFNKDYWGKEKALTRPHHVGFLKSTIHPNGFCMPCCFKLPAKNKSKKNEGCTTNFTVASVPQAVASNAEEDDVSQGNEKYIKGENYAPLESTRYGLLPKELSVFLGNKKCGNRHDGTGLMDQEIDCYLRRGVPYLGGQPFISSLLNVLSLPKNIKTPDQFSKLLADMIDIETFLYIENGKMIRLFIQSDMHINNPQDFKEFTKWFCEQTSYIRKFHLTKIQVELLELKNPPSSSPIYKEILREFTLYNSYKHFIAYLKNPSTLKDHRVLLDVINTKFHDTHIVVFQVDTTTGKTEILCPFNRSTKNVVDLNTSFVFLLKNNQYYEPMYHVTSTTAKYTYDLDNCSPTIRSLVSFYINNCGQPVQGEGESVALFLDSQGYKTRTYVIDYDYRVCGLLLKQNLYIPLKHKMDIPNITHSKAFLYINDVLDFKCMMTVDQIREVYAKLSRHDDFYETDQFISDDKDQVVALKLKRHGSIVPLKLSRKSSFAKSFLYDLQILIGHEDTDPRVEMMKVLQENNEQLESLFQSSIAALYKVEKKKVEYEFLTHPSNPFPLNYRRKRLLKLLAGVAKGQSEKLVGRIIERMLLKTFDSSVPRQYATLPNEVFYTQHDINNDKIRELVIILQDPFRLLSERLDDMMESMVQDKDVPFKSLRRIYVKDSSVFQDVPVVWRKTLKQFEVLQDTDYNALSLYSLFLNVKEAMDSRTRADTDTLRSIIKSRITFYYNTPEIDRFLENESFKTSIKSKTVVKPPLAKCLQVVDSLGYYPSIFELHVLADVVGVNLVIIGRKTQKNPDGLEVIDMRSKYTLVLFMSYDRVYKHDRYELFIKQKKTLLYKKKDLPEDFLNVIENKKKVYDIDVE